MLCQELQADLNALSEAIEALCVSAVHPLPIYVRQDTGEDMNFT